MKPFLFILAAVILLAPISIFSQDSPQDSGEKIFNNK
jgi:hypothetical protein